VLGHLPCGARIGRQLDDRLDRIADDIALHARIVGLGAAVPRELAPGFFEAPERHECLGVEQAQHRLVGKAFEGLVEQLQRPLLFSSAQVELGQRENRAGRLRAIAERAQQARGLLAFARRGVERCGEWVERHPFRIRLECLVQEIARQGETPRRGERLHERLPGLELVGIRIDQRAQPLDGRLGLPLLRGQRVGGDLEAAQPPPSVLGRLVFRPERRLRLLERGARLVAAPLGQQGPDAGESGFGSIGVAPLGIAEDLERPLEIAEHELRPGAHHQCSEVLLRVRGNGRQGPARRARIADQQRHLAEREAQIVPLRKARDPRLEQPHDLGRLAGGNQERAVLEERLRCVRTALAQIVERRERRDAIALLQRLPGGLPGLLGPLLGRRAGQDEGEEAAESRARSHR
jgi:hypothetical protein